jgi:hypothetical protein
VVLFESPDIALEVDVMFGIAVTPVAKVGLVEYSRL